MRRSFLAVAVLAVSLGAHAEERPLLGDAVHGESLIKQSGGAVRVDGAWLNATSDDGNVQKLKSGKDGFPQIESDNVLDQWDALAALRAKNADLKDLMMGGNHVLISETKLDEHAVKRLTEQAKIKSSEIVENRRVFAIYKLGDDAAQTFVSEKDSKKRDKLKKDTKIGYVVFVKMPGFRGGEYEAAIAMDKDVHIQAVEIHGPNGDAPVDLNQAAARFVGKGARGKYDELKAGGAGKAVGEIARPLSDAYLLGAENVYMYEVAERDYFAFD